MFIFYSCLSCNLPAIFLFRFNDFEHSVCWTLSPISFRLPPNYAHIQINKCIIFSPESFPFWMWWFLYSILILSFNNSGKVSSWLVVVKNFLDREETSPINQTSNPMLWNETTSLLSLWIGEKSFCLYWEITYIVDDESQAIYHFYTIHKWQINMTFSLSLSSPFSFSPALDQDDKRWIETSALHMANVWMLYMFCVCIRGRSFS